MTRWMIRAAGLLVVSTGLVLAQEPPKKAASKEPAKPAAGSLEETLDKALQHSADIKVAEAKIRDAEAELNRVRQQVLMKGTALHNDRNLARRMLELAELTYAHQMDLVKRKVVPEDTAMPARIAVEKARGEVEKVEAELKALRGEFAVHIGARSVAFSPDGRFLGELIDGGVRVWDAKTGKVNRFLEASVWAGTPEARPAVQEAMVERVRKMLDTEVEWDGVDGVPFQEVVAHIRKLSEADVPLRFVAIPAEQSQDIPRGKLPVGAFFQAIEDGDPDLRIVVRDYGLLVTTRDRVPEGAIRAVDLWKSKRETKAEPEKKK